MHRHEANRPPRSPKLMRMLGLLLVACGCACFVYLAPGAVWALLPLLSGMCLWSWRRQGAAQAEDVESIIEAVSNAIVVVDAQGRIGTLNTIAARWFGYTREELRGKPIEILVPSRYREMHRQQRDRFLSNPSHRSMGTGRELFGLRKDGSEFPLEIGLCPLLIGARPRILASIVDLSERKKNDERFRLIVEAAPNAMVMVNAEGRIILVNARTEAWFGYSRAELLGQPVEILVPTRQRQPHQSFRQQYMHDAQSRAMGSGRELFGRRKDGSEFPIEIGLNPIQTGEGVLILSSIIDISERKQLEKRFRDHARQVAEASRYKSEFLANMSHELRTPLNSILILSEQLRDNLQQNLMSTQEEHADIIHKSGEDLLALINDILDLSRIEAGQIPIHLEKVILADFVDYLRHSFEPIAENNQLEFSVLIDRDAPAVTVLDFQRVYQIIKNLWSNAVKFTPAGGKILLRAWLDASMDPPQIALSVTDTGCGIPQEQQEQIFQAFQQLDGSISRKYGGTGLGLAISRQLAQCLGGSLRVQSQLGLGSCFTLRLPIRDVPDPPDPGYAPGKMQRQPAVPDRPISRHQLLIIEDDANFSRVIADCAREHHFSCETFQSGSEALASVRRQRPDAVIVDLLLPDLSGWQLIEQLAPWHLPTLIISCLDPPAGENAGAYPYLVKPVDHQQLVRALQQLRAEIERDAQPPAANPASGRTILLVDDDIRNVYAMNGLLEDAGMRVCIARNGAEALETVRKRADIDLILMDMMMPVMDGYQAIASLRSELNFARPILALTALAMKGDREKCLAVGANDYLAKPVRKRELLERIDKLLN